MDYLYYVCKVQYEQLVYLVQVSKSYLLLFEVVDCNVASLDFIAFISICISPMFYLLSFIVYG